MNIKLKDVAIDELGSLKVREVTSGTAALHTFLYMKQRGIPHSQAQLARELNVALRTVHLHLRALRELGWIETAD